MLKREREKGREERNSTYHALARLARVYDPQQRGWWG